MGKNDNKAVAGISLEVLQKQKSEVDVNLKRVIEVRNIAMAAIEQFTGQQNMLNLMIAKVKEDISKAGGK